MNYQTAEYAPDAERLKELLLGKTIVEARTADEPPEKWLRGPTGYLTLSDGTTLKVWGNDGGCACSSGCYPLATLNRVDNIITNVEVVESPHTDEDDADGEGYYKIFVYAADERINVASFEGSDGNGYYGTGWWLDVSDRST